MRRQTIHLPLSCLFALLAVGCVANAPTNTFGKAPGGGTGMEQQQNTSQPDMADPNFVNVPVLDPIAPTTAWDTIPIHGTSSANTTVLIQSMSGSTTSADVDSTGRFCADLTLTPNQANNFQIAAVNLNGTQSDMVTFTVTQQGTPQTTTQAAPVPTNASLGGTAMIQYIGSSTNTSAPTIIDGDTSTWSEGSYSPGWGFSSPAGVVTVALAAASRINQIIAIAPGDCPFYTTITLYYSAADAPSSPDVSLTGWTAVPAVESGNNTFTASFPEAVATNIAAVWVGMSRYEVSGGVGCGIDGNDYGLAELQAWTVPNAAPPPASAPSCSGGQ